MDVACEPVEECAGEALGAEDAGPLVEGRFEVTIIAPRSQRWLINSENNSAPDFERATKPFGAALRPVARSRLTLAGDRDDRLVEIALHRHVAVRAGDRTE